MSYKPSTSTSTQPKPSARGPTQGLNTDFEGIRLEACVVIDATGSMASQIPKAKAFIESLASNMRSYKGLQGSRMAIVGYRDFSDGASHLEVQPFTSDSKAAAAFLHNLKAKGGGDAAEDVRGGVEAALKLDWHRGSSVEQDAKYSKLLIIVGDAPAHGDAYHDMGAAGDDHRDKIGAQGSRLEDLIAQASLEGIDCVFVTVNGADGETAKMISVMEHAYNHPKPGEVPKRFNFKKMSISDSNVRGLASELLGVVDQTINFSSKTLGGGSVVRKPKESEEAWASIGSAGGSASKPPPSSRPAKETSWASPVSTPAFASMSATIAAPSLEALVDDLSPAASRKLKELGCIKSDGSSAGRCVKLAVEDEDVLAGLGVKTGHLKALVKFGVVERAA